MKTQIIYLEAHDDIISVRDKLDWAQLARVLLIFPPEEKVLDSQFDLVLLERHCTALGSQLALVTTDPEVRAHATASGIPVFSSKQEAQSNHWRRSWRAFRRQNLQEDASRVQENHLRETRPERTPVYQLPSWARVAVFSAGVLAVLLFAALLLPGANLTILPQQEPREMTVNLLASPDYQDIQITGELPAVELSVSVAGTDQIATSGIIRIPDEYAAGTAVFQNLTDHDIFIPQGTILSTGGEQPVQFQTLSRTTAVPGNTAGSSVPIRAVDPGSQGNLPAGAVRRIAADFGADLTVTNPDPTAGGSDLTVRAPAPTDREQLLETLTAELRKEARQSLTNILEPGDILLSDQPVVQKIQEEIYLPEGKVPSDTLQLTLRIQFSAWLVEHEALQTLAEEIVRSSSLDDNFRPQLDTLEIKNQTEPLMINTDTARWQIYLRWQEKADFDESKLVRQILGQSRGKALRTIQDQLDLDRSPILTLRPSWWFRIPLLPFRIHFN